MSIDANLGVVSLLKTLRYQVFHHPRIGISEIALTLGQRQDFPFLRYFPFRTTIAFCARFLFFFLTRLLGGGFRFLLQLCFQGANPGQSRFSITQLCRQLITTFAWAVQRVFLFVYSLRLAQQARHFRGQFLLRILHARVGERLVLRGVGFDLGAIDRYVAQLYQPCSLAQLQDLYEQSSQLLEVPLAKSRNAVVIRLLIAAQYPKRHIVIGGLLQLPRRHLPNAVTVDQQLDHQRRVVRRPTATVTLFVHLQNPRKIKRLNHVADVQRQVIWSQPLPQIRRQQQLLIHVV